MLSAGGLIWVSIRPLLRLVICAAGGFAITKADIFPLVAARGAGQNIALPSLMFSKIVPAFTPENASALGPLILVAFVYQFMGMVIAWIVKQFFWVPHRFRYGILVAGGFSNIGDIPTAILLSITVSSPFNGSSDQNLSVAYLAAFILVFMLSLFPLGGHRLIAMDYEGPEVEDSEVRMSVKQKVRTNVQRCKSYMIRLQHPKHSTRERSMSTDVAEEAFEKEDQPSDSAKENGLHDGLHLESLRRRDVVQSYSGAKHVAFHPETSTVVLTDPYISRVGSPSGTEFTPSRVVSPAPTIIYHEHTSQVLSPAPTVTCVDQNPALRAVDTSPPPTSVGPSTTASAKSSHPLHRLLAIIQSAISSFLNPASISIVLAFPISFITPLKALFVSTPSAHIPNAPDGQPPLAFIIDTATFIGGASVPLGLVCLGSALARLKVPRNQWKELPIGAIMGLAIGKMIIAPIFGVLITQGLVHAGIINADDKPLRFVCMLVSCLPTATTQVFLTQVYSGTGNAEHLSAFLIPQYILMVFCITAINVYSIQLLF